MVAEVIKPRREKILIRLFFFFVVVIDAPQESLSQQQTGAEWTILSQGSRELEGLLKLVSKERLQLERHFVLATQVQLMYRKTLAGHSFPVGWNNRAVRQSPFD